MNRGNLFGILSIICILASLVRISAAQQSGNVSQPFPLGRLVDVGGHRLHLNCTGKGRYTVVAEAGASDFSFDWSLVQTGVERFTRICTYDRAGYAWSEAGPLPRTMRQISYELHNALLKAGVKPPFVLVGQSLGGLIIRVFAEQYPKEVAGMVLVDSANEDELVGIIDAGTNRGKIVHWRETSRGRPIPPIQSIMPASGGKDPTRAVTRSSAEQKIGTPFDKLPLKIQQIRLWAVAQPNYNPARISEFDFIGEEIASIYEERRKLPQTLGDMPLIVLSRGVNEYPDTDEAVNKQLIEDHERLQVDLTTLSSNSKHIIAKTSGHHIQLDDPDSVTTAIKQVVNSARHHSKLR